VNARRDYPHIHPRRDYLDNMSASGLGHDITFVGTRLPAVDSKEANAVFESSSPCSEGRSRKVYCEQHLPLM
jgi:hypothetical protein